MVFFDFLARVRKKLQRSLIFVNEWRQHRQLRLQVSRSGAQIEISGGLKIEHTILFQGSGKLILHDSVLLGYKIAGLPAQPILLQPRFNEGVIEIGARSAIMNGCELIACEKIQIGPDCRIGPGTLIIDSNFHGTHPLGRSQRGATQPVIIEDNVWIGARCVILKGVTIGRDAIIAAGSVIYKDVAPGTIVSSASMNVIGNVNG